MNEEQIGHFRLNSVSRWTGIHPKQLQRWCNAEIFIPQNPIPKNSSLHQQYTMEDLRRLYIISLFLHVGVENIKDVNKMLTDDWNNDEKILSILFELEKQRKEYLEVLYRVVKAIQLHGIEIVFSEYAQLLLQADKKISEGTSISDVLKQLANKNFETTTPIHFAKEILQIHDIEKITGMKRRTLYRIYGYLNGNPEGKKNFTLEDCYTFFLVVLIRQIEPQAYTREFMFDNKNATQKEVIATFGTLINRLAEGIEYILDFFSGMEKAKPLMSEIGLFWFVMAVREWQDLEYYNFKNEISFVDIFLLEEQGEIDLGNMLGKYLNKKADSDNYLVYAKKLLKYQDKCIAAFCEKYTVNLSEIEDKKDVYGFLFFTINIEGLDIYEKFVQSLPGDSSTNEVMDQVKRISTLLGKGPIVSNINKYCGDGAAEKLFYFCDVAILISESQQRTKKYLEKLQSIKEMSMERFNARKRSVQSATEKFVDEWKKTGFDQQANPYFFWDLIITMVKLYIIRNLEFIEIMDYAIEALQYLEKKELSKKA